MTIPTLSETSILTHIQRAIKAGSQPSFSFTNVNIAVAMLTTIKVAIARQTASDSVNFHIARMQRTVQATSEMVMTINAIHRTMCGSTTPRVLALSSTTTSGSSCCITELYQTSHFALLRI